jgi:hypothetical protein
MYDQNIWPGQVIASVFLVSLSIRFETVEIWSIHARNERQTDVNNTTHLYNCVMQITYAVNAKKTSTIIYPTRRVWIYTVIWLAEMYHIILIIQNQYA